MVQNGFPNHGGCIDYDSLPVSERQRGTLGRIKPFLNSLPGGLPSQGFVIDRGNNITAFQTCRCGRTARNGVQDGSARLYAGGVKIIKSEAETK